MLVTVFGLGKMGLPLAVQCAHAGHTVLGVDINSTLVAQINAGDMPYTHEPELNEYLTTALHTGRLHATTDAVGAVQQADVILVIVPVKLSYDKQPDLAAILSVTTQIGQHLQSRTLISYETTLPVGTTRDVLIPRLEMLSGLHCSVDFHVVFSPERVKSKYVFRRLHEIPKIVGGASPACTERGIQFYASCFGSQVINAKTLEAAELAKLAGMLYRDVNIALVNQLAIYAMAKNVDLHQIIEWANTDGESALLEPGIGVGGHCTPIYPYFLIQDAEARGLDLSLAKDARRINDTVAASILEVANVHVAGQRVLILGLAFRPDIKEDTASPTYIVNDYLNRLGAEVYVHDPFYTCTEIRARGLQPAILSNGEQFDIAILATSHQAYQAINPPTLKHMGIRLLIDGRNSFNPEAITEAGIQYIGVGRKIPTGD